MHDIMAGIFHRLTRANQSLRNLDHSFPRREGEALASVTLRLIAESFIVPGVRVRAPR
jgi:hypothetical protein